LGRHPTGMRQPPLVNGGVKTDGLRKGLPRFLVHVVDAMVHKSAVMRPSPARIAAELAQLAGLKKAGAK
jgi:hypothetical protein